MRGQTDGQRQQDKKPHHLLLYLIDLISGDHNSGQKQKQKTQKSKKTKGKKQWVTVQQKNTTVDEAGTADGGGRWLDCWHLCASALITALHLLYNTVQLLLLQSHITFHMIYKEIIRAFAGFLFFHGLACITGLKDGHMEKSPSSVHHGLHVWRVRLCSTAGRNKDAFNQVKEKSRRSCRGHTGVSMEPASSICDFSWNNTLFRWLFWHQCENCTNSKAKKGNMTGSNCVLPSISFLLDFICVWLVVSGLADWFQRPHAPFASLSCQEIVWHFWGALPHRLYENITSMSPKWLAYHCDQIEGANEHRPKAASL